MANMITEPVPWLKETSGTTNTTKANASSLDKDAFLKLLVTQLRYQDPLKPMEDKEFISQMANFSALEQMQNLNKGFETLASNINDNLLPALMIQQSSNLVGREISYQDPDSEEEKIIKGTVESVVFKNGNIYCVIAGKEIDMTYLSGIGDRAASSNQQLDQLLGRINDLIDLIVFGEGETGE